MNSPAPAYRSAARSPARGARPSRTARVRTSPALGWICQNTPARTPKRRPRTSTTTWSGARRVRPFHTRPTSRSGRPSRRCRPVSTRTTGRPPSGDADTSSWRAPTHGTVPAAAAFTPSVAIGQVTTGSSSWLRCRWRPTVPSRSTPNATRVRQPRPSGAPPTSSTSTRRSTPPTRASCSATRSSLRRRWAVRRTCWKSHPPHRPGPACGHTGGTRSGDGTSTSTASARRNRVVAEVILAAYPLARQAVPDEDHPAVRAAWPTQPPPAAIAPTSSSTTVVRHDGGRVHARFLAPGDPRAIRARCGAAAVR